MRNIFIVLFLTLAILPVHAQWSTNGTLLTLPVTTGGLVGIGTSTPLGYLHVNPTRPVIIRNNGGNGVYGSEIGFNAILNTGVTPNRFKKLGGTSQEGGANISVDYRGNMFFQMADAPNENEYEIDYKPQIAFLNTGKVGIGTVTPSANVQIGSGTENGLLNLGGYATIGSLRSSGDFYAGMNAYTEYTTKQNYNIKVLNTNTYGFSAMQLGYTGEISFFSKNGSVTADEIANVPANLKMKISGNGNVGIGIETPTQKLQINGSVLIPVATAIDNSSPGIIAAGGDDFLYASQYLNNYGLGFHNYNDGNGVAGMNAYLSGYYGVSFFTGGLPALRINRNGNVGIGTDTPDAKLAVNGQVHATEVKVTATVPGPDYVFEKDYALPSLESVKTYIDQNKHLPEVPSAKEMEANGINLSEMNMLLLKKVEELTLYVIELKKGQESVNEDNQRLRKELEKLKKEINH